MNKLWQEHLERLDTIHGATPRRTTPGDAEDAVRGEWSARPPGRLGRRLLADVERYLDFFATARS
jgi:hypothetical protein